MITEIDASLLEKIADLSGNRLRFGSKRMKSILTT